MAPFLSKSRSKEPFKRAVFFFKGGGVTRFICEIITRIMIDCIARNILLLTENI